MVVIENDTVQLLDKSVRDFLLGRSSGLPINDPKAHASMANRRINFFREPFGREESRRRVTKQADSSNMRYYTGRDTSISLRMWSKLQQKIGEGRR